jgi:DNA-binding SARP family transcriptional activator
VVEFRMLGVMEIEAAGRLLDPGPPKQRLVLAALLLEAGRPVAIDTLIDRVWDEAPPPGARDIIYAHVSRMRRLLALTHAEGATPARLDRRSGGYLLSVDPELVDAHRFRRLVGHARCAEGAEVTALPALRSALLLWRGVPLADVPGDWAARVRADIVRLRLSAATRWAELELRRRNQRAVIDGLYPLVGEYPLDETLAAMLVRALHADGCAAEALRCYASARRQLADELGAKPGAVLRAAGESVLRSARAPALTPR